MSREIVVSIPGPGRADADFGDFVVRTDHPGDDRADGPVEPWFLFLASVGTCAAAFVAAWCREEGLPAEGLRLVQREVRDGDLVRGFEIEIRTPPGFPPGREADLVRAAGECTVKRVLEAGPDFRIVARAG